MAIPDAAVKSRRCRDVGERASRRGQLARAAIKLKIMGAPATCHRDDPPSDARGDRAARLPRQRSTCRL
jgi:hypothetical protein